MTRSLSFRGRLTLQWTAAFGLLMLLASLAIYAASRRYAYDDLDADVRTLAATELASAVDDDRGVHLHDFPAASMEHGSYADKFAQIVTGDGTVVKQSGLPTGTPSLIDSRRRAEAQAGRASVFTVRAGTRWGRMTALSTRQGGVEYVVGVGLGSTDLEASLGQLARLLAFVWVACVAATGGIGYVLASRALAPVERIAASAAAIARGEHRGSLDPPTANDEIGRMTGHLNAMLASLRAAIESNRRFAADASHELRGPITSIRGEIEVALKRERSAEAYRETLALVGRQAADMADMAENLMLLVRSGDARSDLELAEVPLGPLLRAATARVGEMAASQDVAVQVGDLEGFVVHSNERLLSRVLDNLLRNAVQYNRRGGAVRVDVEAETASSPDSQRLVLRVRDTGCGIDRADWERVFDPFYRVDASRSRRTGGSGLGLAICRDALVLLHGEVRIVDSTPSGTVVEVRLPGAPSSHRGLTRAS